MEKNSPSPPSMTPEAELEMLKTAIRKGGYGIMKCSNGWFIVDISEAHLREQAETVKIITRNIDLEIVATAADAYVQAEPGDLACDAYQKLATAVARLDKKRRELEPMITPVKDADRNEIRIIVTGTPGIGRTSVAAVLADHLRQRAFEPEVFDPSDFVNQASFADHLARLQTMRANQTRIAISIPHPNVAPTS